MTNEDYAGALVRFAGGAVGSFECSRSMVGPESQMAFEVYGTKGALAWNLEQLNELRVHLVDDDGCAPRGYTTVYGGDRYPFHGHFVPGDANAIGFEDVVTIEDYAFLDSVARGRAAPARPRRGARLRHLPGGAGCVRARVGRWEDVDSTGGRDRERPFATRRRRRSCAT